MDARIGHVHLKVRQLDRAVEFYTALLGWSVTESMGGRFAFLSGGDDNHELALQAVGDDAPAPSRGGIGLYHTAFEVADEDQLREAYRRATELGLEPTAVDHGISWAIYLRDPDDNGVEVYCDRRASESGVELWDGRSERIDHLLRPETAGASI